MRFPKKQEIDTTDIAKKIQENISALLKSGIFEDSGYMKSQMDKSYEFTRRLAELIWDTKELMNKADMIAPRDQYTVEQKSKYMIHFSKDFKEIDVFAPTIEYFNDGDVEPSPAYVSDGINDFIDDSCEKVFLYLQTNFSIPEQLELLDTIVQWYDTNFVNPKCDVQDSVIECLRKFGDKIKQAISKFL